MAHGTALATLVHQEYAIKPPELHKLVQTELTIRCSTTLQNFASCTNDACSQFNYWKTKRH